MAEVTFRFARMIVIVFPDQSSAVLVPLWPFSTSQPVRLTLDELEAALLKSQKERAK